MHTINVQQNTEEWLKARRGLITGSKIGSTALEEYAQTDVSRILDMRAKALTAAEKAKTTEKAEEYKKKAEEYKKKADLADLDNDRLKVPVGFWQYLAELYATPDAEYENPAERGHRLENINAGITVQKLGINEDTVDYEPTMWARDDEPRIAVSPDVTETGDKPSWAIECKSLSTANHIMYVLPFLIWKKNKVDLLFNTLFHEYRAATREYDFVPGKYKPQVLQYFAVNDDLQTLYFSFYDDRINNLSFSHAYLTIPRDDIVNEINDHYTKVQEVLGYSDLITNLVPVEPENW